MRRSLLSVGWLLVALTSMGMASKLPRAPQDLPQARSGAALTYDELFPTYAEFCAATQISKKSGFGLPVQGGIGGHGLIYLRGACRDRAAAYPRIKLCDPDTESRGLEPGVGVSVNSDFRNVNWTAVDTKAFFLTGDLKPGEKLDEEAYLRARQKAVDTGVLQGIEFHEELFKKKLPGMSDFEFMLEDTMGTDYAISFGRSLYCARLPITRPMLIKMVDWLNAQNDQYYLTGKRYIWDGIKDNCTHTTHNALNAAEVWDYEVTNKFILRQIFHIAVPSHNFLDLMERGNRQPLDDVLALYQDGSLRRALLEEGWMPARHGVLAELFPIVQENEIYNTNLGMLFLGPEGLLKRKRFDKVTTDQRFLDIETNLRWFKKRYEKALKEKESAEAILFRLESVGEGQLTLNIDRKEFNRFHAAYYAQLEAQLRELELQLTKVESRK